MPARVVVVKRARRRSFALLWAAPAWIRSAWSAFSAPTQSRGLESGFVNDAGMPALLLSADAGHRCTACGVCVEICPGRALLVKANQPPGSSEGAAGSDVTRFELDPGRCVGCRVCVEDCPEDALVMRATPQVAIAQSSGWPLPIDLLGPELEPEGVGR